MFADEADRLSVEQVLTFFFEEHTAWWYEIHEIK